MGDMADYYMDWVAALDLENGGQVDDDIPRRRTVPKETKRATGTMAKLQRNKFYVGSQRALDNNWGHATLAKAVKHAEELLGETETADFTFVVQIIRVVKRKRLPAEVVKV